VARGSFCAVAKKIKEIKKNGKKEKEEE